MTQYLLLAVGIAIGTFFIFWKLCRRKRGHRLYATIALILSVPAALFVSNYILKVPDGGWFINFHSLPGTEALSGLVGGVLAVMFSSAWLRRRSALLAISTAVAAMLIIAPFAKQIFFKMDYAKLESRWKDGVCLQTSPTTCIPATCATVIRMIGGNLTEQELAREAGTNRRGTEMWYMKRALRRHGYDLQVRTCDSLKDASAPSILGVGGHVVVLTSKTASGPEIGDPLGPHRRYTWEAFERRYHPRRDYFVIRAMD